MQRNIFEKTKFTKGDLPRWVCPACGATPLLLESLDRIESSISREEQKFDWSEPDWATFVFLAKFKCPNPKCEDIVAVSGDGKVVDHRWQDFETGANGGEFEDEFYPKMLSPHQAIFDIPKDAPENVSSHLSASFAIFYASPSAALNEARKALELLLDAHGVSARNESGQWQPLGRRLQLLPDHLAPHAKLFSAVRWLGNAGSHPEEIDHSAVLDAYELLSGLLDEIYSGKRDRLLTLAERIDRAKGPSLKQDWLEFVSPGTDKGNDNF